jgi:hypothetical protein
MLEKLTETITKFQNNPMEALKGLMEEEKKLKTTVITNQPSTVLLVQYLQKKYTKEELDAVSWNLQNFIEQKMKPSLTDRLLSDIQDPLDEIQKTFWSWESEIEALINDYADLFHKQSCDQKKIEEWMTTHDIQPLQLSVNTTTISTTAQVSPEVILEMPQLDTIIELAKSEIGTNEKDNTADKYFRELWYKYDSKNQPWCWAFVSRVLMKSWFPVPKNDLSAKAFLEESGKWHVWIKVEDKVVSWNYWNKVSSDTINKKIIWYAIPTPSGLQIHKENIKFDKIPNGAVIVFDRDSKRSQAA